jgi:hypothetical protein
VGYIDDVKADHTIIPGVVTVSHTGTGGTVTSGVAALIDDAGPNYKEITVGVAGIESTDTVWWLWDATLDSVTPERGGKITETGGTVWTILSVNPVRCEGTVVKWRCVCREQA